MKIFMMIAILLIAISCKKDGSSPSGTSGTPLQLSKPATIEAE